jgi:hypothetical protein
MSSVKGLLGEDRVSFLLEALDKPDYRIGNNVLMLNDDGRSLQIDHIVVSIYGIFVIETKNYKGIIVGNEKDKQWTQYTETRQYSLYNPIRQNFGHMQELRKILWNGLKMVSIICFTERSELQVTSYKTDVVHPFGVVNAIRKHQKEVFNLEQVDYICEKIRDRVKMYRRAKRDHIGNMLVDRANRKIESVTEFNRGIAEGFIHPAVRRDTSPYLK